MEQDRFVFGKFLGKSQKVFMAHLGNAELNMTKHGAVVWQAGGYIQPTVQFHGEQGCKGPCL